MRHDAQIRVRLFFADGVVEIDVRMGRSMIFYFDDSVAVEFAGHGVARRYIRRIKPRTTRIRYQQRKREREREFVICQRIYLSNNQRSRSPSNDFRRLSSAEMDPWKYRQQVSRKRNFRARSTNDAKSRCAFEKKKNTDSDRRQIAPHFSHQREISDVDPSPR